MQFPAKPAGLVLTVILFPVKFQIADILRQELRMTVRGMSPNFLKAACDMQPGCTVLNLSGNSAAEEKYAG